VPDSLPQKIIDQMRKACLPTSGQHPFRPKLVTNRSGDQIIEKRSVANGPKKGKRGYVDELGRIWIKDRSHAMLPDHWDVWMDDGHDYLRIDLDGNLIP
jgi:hypothetical protein